MIKKSQPSHDSIIEMAPLQIYCSALLFAPEGSLVRENFRNQIPDWIHRLPKVQKSGALHCKRSEVTLLRSMPWLSCQTVSWSHPHLGICAVQREYSCPRACVWFCYVYRIPLSLVGESTLMIASTSQASDSTKAVKIDASYKVHLRPCRYVNLRTNNLDPPPLAPHDPRQPAGDVL